jgi:hypothetical protein
VKYTINGFSQQEALKFKKNVLDKNGKEKEIKIDSTDLLILRWFVDFYPKMMKVEIEGIQYAWVQYQKILQDLPLLDIKKQALFDRFKKMCEFEILTHKTVKVNGTFSYYGFGCAYGSLIDTENSQISKGVYSTNEGVNSKLNKGNELTNEQINTSIKDTSIIDNSIKERKTNYDTIISEKIEDAELKALIYGFIKMRKLKKKPLTDLALTRQLDNLMRLSNDIEEQKEIVGNSIDSCWDKFYPLKKGANNVQRDIKADGSEYDFLS